MWGREGAGPKGAVVTDTRLVVSSMWGGWRGDVGELLGLSHENPVGECLISYNQHIVVLPK